MHKCTEPLEISLIIVLEPFPHKKALEMKKTQLFYDFRRNVNDKNILLEKMRFLIFRFIYLYLI
jgi:hypothetical protein